jgi:hypothetical protein
MTASKTSTPADLTLNFDREISAVPTSNQFRPTAITFKWRAVRLKYFSTYRLRRGPPQLRQRTDCRCSERFNAHNLGGRVSSMAAPYRIKMKLGYSYKITSGRRPLDIGPFAFMARYRA